MYDSTRAKPGAAAPTAQTAKDSVNISETAAKISIFVIIPTSEI